MGRDPNKYYPIISVVVCFPSDINPLGTSSEEYDTSCKFFFQNEREKLLKIPCALYIIGIMKYLGSFLSAI